MKYLTQGNCPYCDAERGIQTAWAMHPMAMEELKERHDKGHPENPNYKMKLKEDLTGYNNVSSYTSR